MLEDALVDGIGCSLLHLATIVSGIVLKTKMHGAWSLRVDRK